MYDMLLRSIIFETCISIHKNLKKGILCLNCNSGMFFVITLFHTHYNSKCTAFFGFILSSNTLLIDPVITEGLDVFGISQAAV